MRTGLMVYLIEKFVNFADMQILNTSQVREADAYTIKNEPVLSIDLMERAALAIAGWFDKNCSKNSVIRIFAGPGNNGGDGLAVGRLLTDKGFAPRHWILASESGYSPDTSINLDRLKAMSISPSIIASPDDFPDIDPGDFVIDALFGTGLSRPLTGIPASLIKHINGSGARVVAVDIPSGLFADDNRKNTGENIIRADNTLSFQFPKLAFMFSENDSYVGKWEVLPIGLHKEFTDSINTPWILIDENSVKPMIIKRSRFAHKGSFGHSLLIAGSYGKMGAAVLATGSCLRAGAGLVTVHVPLRGCDIMQTSVPEAMVSVDECDRCFSSPPELEKFDAVAAGPGLGMDYRSQQALFDLLGSVNVPLVLDADALNIIALHSDWMGLIPENSVITPHPGEFDRLTKQHKTSHDRLISQTEMAEKHKIIVVLKGARTSVVTPDGTCYFNGNGNNGMATAGSGDVLTGIILSLLGQGYKADSAAISGVFLHGLAGDLAAYELSEEAMIAGDITARLGKAYKQLKQ